MKYMTKSGLAALFALAATPPAALCSVVMADATAGDLEATLKDVQAQLANLNGEVKATAEKALAQSKKSGDVSAETKATADQLLTAQNSLNGQVEEITAKLEGLEQSNLDLAQGLAAGGGRGASGAVSMGRAVSEEGADAIKAYLSGGAAGGMSFNVQAAITTAATSAGGLIFHDEERAPVNMARRRLRIVDMISAGRTGSDLVTYRKQTLRTDATAMVAEQGTYPASAFGWTKATENVRKVGAVTNLTEEALADADQLQTEIDTELRYGVEKEIEEQVLAGDGTGENLSGLITNATAFAAAAGLPNANAIDRLRLGILQVALADYVADGIVLNPTDWAAIELIKKGAGDASYVFGQPGTGNMPMLWGKAVAESNSMSAGEWLVGEMAIAATLYERSGLEVLISSEHGTNFVEDMLTMKARKRLALAVKRGAALVTGNFTFA